MRGPPRGDSSAEIDHHTFRALHGTIGRELGTDTAAAGAVTCEVKTGDWRDDGGALVADLIGCLCRRYGWAELLAYPVRHPARGGAIDEQRMLVEAGGR
jgi:hypothetical protein